MSRYLLVTAWGIFILFRYIPLPLYYAVFYLLLFVTAFERRDYKKSLYTINLQFVYFVAIDLIVLGFLALVKHADIHDVLLHSTLQGIGLVLTLSVNTAGISLASHASKRYKMPSAYDRQEFSLLAKSMWFWLAIVLADSIPSMFRLPGDLISLFLICSNTLILLLLAFFHMHVYHITQSAYLEEEQIRLQMEEKEQRLRTAKIEKTAYVDHLTGAFTRTFAKKQMDEMIDKGLDFGLVYIDLDSLKRINDTQGHVQGDAHLKLFVQELKSLLRKQDILSRIGGDEFLVLMPYCTEAEVKQRMKAIRKKMETDESCKISYSYGVTFVSPHGGKSIAEYLEEADAHMYEDKKARQ